MSKNITDASNVIQFNFGKQQVRTLVLDDQPWFFAVDVCGSLGLADTNKALIGLDDDEKCEHEQYSGSGRKPILINESGLYSMILRSRKTEAKRFKKWVTAEVLPAIRKHGRYDDAGNKMATLMDAMIGMTELNVIKGLIRDKAKAIPTTMHQSFALTMHRRLHTRFNVPRTELIPAGQFEAACNFIGSYALEGEYLGKEEAKGRPDFNFPIESLVSRRPEMLTQRGSGQAWLDVTIHDLRDIRGNETPLENLLWELEREGYDIRGAWWEFRTYRNKMRELCSFAAGMGQVVDKPHRYAVDGKGEAA